MNTTIITVGSVTYAIKVKKLLERSGIRSKLIKVESSTSPIGCTYGIKIESSLFYDAVALLRNQGIDYSVYKNDIP